MGIRRQDQYLASRYANGRRDVAKPQDDFERQSLDIIDPDRRYFVDGVWLDYKMTRDLITDAVGKKNVLVLPLEQLATEPSLYFLSLSTFLGKSLNPNSLTSAVRTDAASHRMCGRYVERQCRRQ